MPVEENEFPKRRRSACADASLRAEIERVSRMTPEQRIRAALSMQEKFKRLLPPAKSK